MVVEYKQTCFLKNCLFRDEDDTLFETMKTLFKNETPERVKEEEQSHSVTVTDELNLVKHEIPQEEKEEKEVTQVVYNSVFVTMKNIQSP